MIRFLIHQFNKKYLALYVSITVISISTLNSCTKAIIDEGEPNLNNQIIKFNPHVNDIMFNHCVTCHGGALVESTMNKNLCHQVVY